MFIHQPYPVQMLFRAIPYLAEVEMVVAQAVTDNQKCHIQLVQVPG
jgi:hypothetical protein